MGKYQKGFTLAELLIALAILGVIATFTIPKVLNAGQSGQNTAIAKEAASMVSGAFSSYQLNNSISAATDVDDLTAYMNYVQVAACGGDTCMDLHSGAILKYQTGSSFGGTSSTASMVFNLDPDGGGTQTDVSFILFRNGRITTGGVAGAAVTNYVAPGNDLTVVTPDPNFLSSWN